MAENIAPFPEPEYAKLETQHVKQAVDLLVYSDKSFIVNIGREILQSSTVLLPSHFHRMALRMESPAQERSFKRGACLGLAFVALKSSEVAIDEEMFYGHYDALHDYRKGEGEETIAAAAMRLGNAMLKHDPEMSTCASYAVFVHPGDRFDPQAMQAGVGYAEALAEQALNPGAIAARKISIASLNEQYGEELAGIFDGIDE